MHTAIRSRCDENQRRASYYGNEKHDQCNLMLGTSIIEDSKLGALN